MQVLYAVEFIVLTRDPTVEPFQRCVEQTAKWLSLNSNHQLTAGDLVQVGSANLTIAAYRGVPEVQRHVTWEVVGGGEERAVRVSATQSIPESDLELTTRVTVSVKSQKVSIRIGMSRELVGGFLTSASETDVYQPGIIRQLAFDKQLDLRVGAQAIDARFIPVRTETESDELARILSSNNRLPIVLIHLRSPESWEVAKVLSSKLVGLARVITLNYATSRKLTEAIPSVSVPFGGLRLVWSDIKSPSLGITAEAIERLKAAGIRKQLMTLLAVASALSRGSDDGWRSARLAAQTESLRRATLRAEQARNNQDTGAELEALRAQNADLSSQLHDWRTLAEEEETRADRNESLAYEAEASRGEADYWREQYLAVVRSPESDKDPWESIPGLIPRSDAQETFLALQDAAEGRIVFADSANRSWRKIDYPEPEDMTSKLTQLAKAASHLYGETEYRGGHLDDWFMENFGLKVAMSDGEISRTASIRYFIHEDARYDQTAHVKVRDGVKPNQVGRIHFALDAANRRIIVGHVALKLYAQ